MGALVSALWNNRQSIWEHRVKVSYVLSILFLIFSVTLALFWFFHIITFSGGVISIALFPPPPVPPQLSQPCEVYTRTQLGDIVVYEPNPPQAYVENTRLNNAIEKVMTLEDEPEGVEVLYAPPHSGKTTAITHVLHKLHTMGKVNVLQLRAGTFSEFIVNRGGDRHLSLAPWLQQSMGCTKPFSSIDVSDIFSYDRSQPRSVLFIDQFESITTEAELTNIKNMMHKVAVDVANRKNYITLVATSDLDVFQEMLTWNGGKKFQAVVEGGFIWTQEELQHVVDTYQRKGFISPATATPASMAALQEAMKNMTTIRSLRNYLREFKLIEFPTPLKVDL